MKSVLMLLTLCGNFAFALEPPFYSSAKEIKTILDSKEVQETLGTHLEIIGIIKDESNYLVLNSQCAAEVNVSYEIVPHDDEKEMPFGPSKITVSVGKTDCPDWSEGN